MYQFDLTQPWHYGIKRGSKGTDVAAMQLNIGVVPDGVFGQKTEDAVKDWQRRHNLLTLDGRADGIVGPKTYQSLVVELSTPAARFYKLPVGMAKSIAFAESGFVIGASGKHAADPGYDVGPYMMSSQRSAPTQQFIFEAFNVGKAADNTCKSLAEFRNDVLGSVEVAPSRYLSELANGDKLLFKWLMAVLAHNWPYAAEQIPERGHIYDDPSRDDKPEAWIEVASDGHLHTPREWVTNYVTKSTVFVEF